MKEVRKLYIQLEEIGALALFLGLVAMLFDKPSFFTTIGIVFWLSAQFSWLYWRVERVPPNIAVIFMGILNLLGSSAFCYGSIISGSILGCLISAAYLISATQQFLSGMVRLSFFHKNKALAYTQAMQCLIIAACFQVLAAMGFIVLSAIPGMLFSIAAITSVIGHILKYQQSLLQSSTAANSSKQKQNKPFIYLASDNAKLRNDYRATK